jgi:hypothetical protein
MPIWVWIALFTLVFAMGLSIGLSIKLIRQPKYPDDYEVIPGQRNRQNKRLHRRGHKR